MWPLSGERWVDVCGTIVPPVRARRRWRILPVISAPGAGERIARRAVDRGRAAGAVVTAPPPPRPRPRPAERRGPQTSLHLGPYGKRMGWVASAGGHTRARVYGATHSQITLAARRFSPAWGVPGAPKRSPLPLGSEPRGRFARRADSATAGGEKSRAAGSTHRRSAMPPENPDRPGSHRGCP